MTMEWQTIIALVIAVPVILFPVLFVWYLNIGRIVAVVRAKRAQQPVRQKSIDILAQAEETRVAAQSLTLAGTGRNR